MKKLLRLLLVFTSLMLGIQKMSQAGDTLMVYAHDKTLINGYGDYYKWVSFPAAHSYRKIIMYYTLQCPQGNNCSDYDYTQQIFIRAKGGKKDSIPVHVEITRLINPFGIDIKPTTNLVYRSDVTDYAPLLQDSLYMGCSFSGYPANGQGWLLSLRFEMIEGTAPREAYKIENLWNGSFPYGRSTSLGDTIETYLHPITVTIDSNAKSTMLRVVPTGHGGGGSENCAEFCAKNYTLKMNNSQLAKVLIWRDDCGLNPVYPGIGAQANGTWIYDRANWCPGALIKRFDHELTGKVIANNSYTFDINMDKGQAGNYTSYIYESHLIYYHDAAFTNDASIEDILAPSKDMAYNRFNPICGSPEIRIKNTGTATLQHLKIMYGMNDNFTDTFNWTGNLPFLEEEKVVLPPSNKIDFTKANIFKVKIENDDYADNNSMSSAYAAVPVYPGDLVVVFSSNKAGSENSFVINNSEGIEFLSDAGFSAYTDYTDTVHLENGCYTFQFDDSGKDGLSFFGNNDGTGSLKLTNANTNKTLKVFPANFGTSIIHHFIVQNIKTGMEKNNKVEMSLYPNPNNGKFHLQLSSTLACKKELSITNIIGETLFTKILNENESQVTLDMRSLQPGIYFLKMSAENQIWTEKMMITE